MSRETMNQTKDSENDMKQMSSLLDNQVEEQCQFFDQRSSNLETNQAAKDGMSSADRLIKQSQEKDNPKDTEYQGQIEIPTAKEHTTENSQQILHGDSSATAAEKEPACVDPGEIKVTNSLSIEQNAEYESLKIQKSISGGVITNESNCDKDEEQIKKELDINNNKNMSATEEPELSFQGQVFDSSSPTGTLLIAAQDMSSTLTGALHAITSTPPTPPLRSVPSSRTPLPPTPPPPTTHPLYNESNGDNNSLPSPPTEMVDGLISQSYMEKTPPRPIPPAEVIEDLEKKIEIQYKKYPKLESTSSKPATPLPPLPPERSNSQGKVRSVKSSPQHTPTMQRKIKIKAVRTPSSSPVPFETAKLQV